MTQSQIPEGLPLEPIRGEQSPCFPPRANEDAERAKTLLEAPNASITLAPDLDQTLQFLRALDSTETFTFQALPEAKNSTARPTVLHGSIDEHAPRLISLNQRGAGIFVMVNAGDGVIRPGAKTCRTEGNVIRVRALFVDLDGAPLEPVLAVEDPPDLVVATSPGRWHCYWVVDDCQLDEFSWVQISLAEQFGGDPSVCDLPRLMRLPGFWHLKSETPFLSHLVEFDRAGSGVPDDA